MGWLNPQLVPEGLDLDSAIFYGARWIAPDDNLPDRQSVSQHGKDDLKRDRDAFIEWMNSGVLRDATAASRRLHDCHALAGNKDTVATLYEDDYGFFIASDFSSYGYTYAGAFRRQDVPDYTVMPVRTNRRYVEVRKVEPGMLIIGKVGGVKIPKEGLLVVDIQWRDEIIGTITDQNGAETTIVAPLDVEVLV